MEKEEMAISVSDQIRGLIIDAEQIHDPERCRRAGGRSEVFYETELSDGATCVIARYTAKNPDRKTRLVLIGEQEQFYIKNPDGTIEPVTPDSLTKFLRQSENDIILTENTVFDRLVKGKTASIRFCSLLTDRQFLDAAKHGLVKLSATGSGWRRDYIRILQDDAWLSNPSVTNWYLTKTEDLTGLSRSQVLDHAFDTTPLLKNGYWIPLKHETFETFLYLEKVFGPNIVRTAYERMLKENVYWGFPTTKTIHKLFNAGKAVDFEKYIGPDYGTAGNLYFEWKKDNMEDSIRFDGNRFFKYLLQQSLKEGFADNLNEFVITWSDTLAMEKLLYGKVRDKYPENLSLLHNQYSYRCRMQKEKIDHQAWLNAAEIAKRFERIGTEWSLISPKTTDDITLEAVQMNNCVASYIPKVLRGECVIMFLRKTDAPEKSVCTVELDPRTGNVLQFKGKRNAKPTPEQFEALDELLRKTGETTDAA